MNLKYYEKVIIAAIIFIGVVIFTAYSIGTYIETKKKIDNEKNNVVTGNKMVLDNINLF